MKLTILNFYSIACLIFTNCWLILKFLNFKFACAPYARKQGSTPPKRTAISSSGLESFGGKLFNNIYKRMKILY